MIKTKNDLSCFRKRLNELKVNNKPIPVQAQQTRLLEVMDSIETYCKENGLRYYLAYGTLLGAIRHKGFIPWDDDIDIWMPREDYNKFIGGFNNGRNKRFKTVNYDTKGYYLPFAKVIDTDTIVLEYITQPLELGLYIDVFPLDFCGDNKKKFLKEYRKKFGFTKFMHFIKNTRLDKDRPIYKKIVIFVLKILFLPFSRDKVNESLDRKAQEFSQNCETSLIGSIAMLSYGEKELLESKWFGDGIETDFEGRQYRIPNNYEAILAQIYGDYMKLPPEEKRHGLHNIVAYWK